MYVTSDFQTKKALLAAIRMGERLEVQNTFNGSIVENGQFAIEGPWYPQPHKWYATVTVVDGSIVEIEGKHLQVPLVNEDGTDYIGVAACRQCGDCLQNKDIFCTFPTCHTCEKCFKKFQKSQKRRDELELTKRQAGF